MNHLCIVYNGGSYGTFVEWSLSYFGGLITDPTLPFTANGSSHNFKYECKNTRSIEILKNLNNVTIYKQHPKTSKDDDIFNTLDIIDSHFNYIIFLHHTLSSVAWNINNKIDKIPFWSKYEHLTSEEWSNCLREWGVDSYLSAARWQQREFLSLNIYQQHEAETEILKLDKIRSQFSNFKFVPIEDLRDNYKDTLLSLLDFCKFTPVNIDQVDYVYNEWLKLQFHCNKDQIINNIVTSIINSTNYSWSNLTLVDEALIQYYLRNIGIEIRCYELNDFPTNTVDLKKYLYNK